jgi:hypothetical protein
MAPRKTVPPAAEAGPSLTFASDTVSRTRAVRGAKEDNDANDNVLPGGDGTPMRWVVAALLVALTCIAPAVVGTGGSHSHPAISSTDSTTGSYREPVLWVHRDSHGKMPRSEKAVDDFKKSHPCPATGSPHGSCPGYVIDHVVPLKRGGVDSPSNMRWQKGTAAKQMDRLE